MNINITIFSSENEHGSLENGTLEEEIPSGNHHVEAPTSFGKYWCLPCLQPT